MRTDGGDEMSATRHPNALSAAPTPESPSAVHALRTLTDAVQELWLAKRIDDLQRIVCAAARRLASADGSTFALRDAEQCLYVDEEAIEPL